MEALAFAFLVIASIAAYVATTWLAIWLGKVVAPRIQRLVDRATEEEEEAGDRPE